MLRDLRHAVRVLLRAKGWTLVVVVSLALGIGANTALFSAVNGLLIKPISVDDPGTLVRLRWTGDNDAARNVMASGYTGRGVSGSFSFAVFEALRDANETLSGLFAGASTPRLNLVLGGLAEVGSGFAASGDYFRVLGVRAIAGRVLLADDDRAGAEPVAVISHRFWERHFGLDATAVGTAIVVNDVPTTIVGVLPPGFTGVARATDEPVDVHLPLQALAKGQRGSDMLSDPTFWWLTVMGRLAPGATIAQAQGNLDGVLRATAGTVLTTFLEGLTPEERARDSNRNQTAAPRLLVESARRGLYDANPRASRQAVILGVVVVLVLLIVCANVATLLLSRAATRRREVAVRLAVGASRSRLVRQLVTESLLLSVVGGTLAVPVASTARRLLPFGQTTPFDWRVFGFVTLVSLGVGLAFSVGPAFRATRLDLAGTLGDGRSVAPARSRLTRALLVAQVAVSLALLVGAGLFAKTLTRLREVEVGFNADNVLLFRADPSQSGYAPDEANRLADRLEARLEAIPGVRAVARSQLALLSGGVWTSTLYVPGKPDAVGSHMLTVSPEFFDTMEIPLLSGRTFGPQDGPDAPSVALVNTAAALELFGSADAVGRLVGSSREEAPDVEIIGVVADAKYSSLREAAPPTMFRSVVQTTPTAVTFAVRTSGSPTAIIPAVRDTVRLVEPRLPLMDVTTQEAEVEERLGDERLYAVAYTSFAGLATLLAAIGLFGLASYSVTQRTNEIGVRMALGAQSSNIARMVLRESLTLVTVGIIGGVLTVLLAGRLVASLLYELSPTDPTTLLQAAGILLTVAAVAVYLPGRRAACVDPTVALQDE